MQVLNTKGKVKRFGRFIGRRRNERKAYVSLKPGQEIDYEPLPDGSVRMFAVPPKVAEDNPFRKWRGTGVSGMTTEEIMRETRGDDWGR